MLVDIHSHLYLPRYASLLRSRLVAPRILTREGIPGERLVILDDEPSAGRPVNGNYWDRELKLKFMDLHGIDISVVRSVPLLLCGRPAKNFEPSAQRIHGWTSSLQQKHKLSPQNSMRTLKNIAHRRPPSQAPSSTGYMDLGCCHWSNISPLLLSSTLSVRSRMPLI